MMPQVEQSKQVTRKEDKLLDVSEVDDPGFQRYRIIKLLALGGCWISIGLFSSILGPTLPDITKRLSVSIDQMSWVLIGRDLGMIFGSLTGGFLNERFYHKVDLILSTSLFAAAISSACAPNFYHVGPVAAMFVINGFSEGLINTGGITMIMHMWGKEKSGSAQLFIHFGYGVGSLLCPQIAKPFLGTDGLDDNSLTNITYNSTTIGTTIETVIESRIEIAYGIIAALVSVFAIIMLVFHFSKKPDLLQSIYRPSTSFSKDMISPGSCAKGHLWIGLALFVLLFLQFIQLAGGDRIVANFLFTYAVSDELNMPNNDAANLNTVYWVGYTCGRGVGSLIAKFVPIFAMTLGNVIGVFLVVILFFFFGSNSTTGMWVSIPILGLFMGPLFPQFLTWSNLYMDMNPIGVMVLLIGGNVGGIVYQTIMADLFEKDPRNLLFGLIFYACAVGVLYIALQLIGYCYRKKLKPSSCTNDEKSTNTKF